MKKLEIEKNVLINNINIIKKLADEVHTQIIAVVKSNGMGLGIVEYSKMLIESGIQMLAVAAFDEALKLRNEQIDIPILMLSPCSEKEELKVLIENDIILTISNNYEWNIIKEILDENPNLNANAHIKIDTGFGRYGFLYNNFEEIYNILNSKQIKISGMYTHFSKSIDRKWTTLQFNRFMGVVKSITSKGYKIEMLHVSNSTAFLKYPQMSLNAVRIGSAFQGRTLVNIQGLKKVGTFKSNIVEIKLLPKGYTISYNNTYKLKRNSKIAIVPVGYIDGLNKNKLRDDFSIINNFISVFMELKKCFRKNNLVVQIHGKKYEIIGRIGMYHSIVDITDDMDIDINDEVILPINPLQTNDIIRREFV